jgi:hypothetical protein
LATTGPNKWGELGGAKICGDGKRQSPIDIPYPSPFSRSNGPLTLAYKPSLIHVNNNGHGFVMSSRMSLVVAVVVAVAVVCTPMVGVLIGRLLVLQACVSWSTASSSSNT